MPAPPPSSAARPRGARPDGSMSLLVDITTNSLDAAYADHAVRRSVPAPAGVDSRAHRERSTGRRLAGVALLVALGLLTGTAVAQVRERAESSTGLRGELVEKVRERTAETDALAAEADRVRAQVEATREGALGADAAGRAVAESVAALALAAGTVPVVGPGIVVTVDDAPADPDSLPPPSRLRGGTSGPARVLDRDLQDVVNGIWAAGAEAVSVNGIRLTALTAIRSAGEAILVDFRPLSPPYVIEAIGDPEELEVGFLDGPSGRRFTTYTSLYGLGLQVRRAEELALSGAGEPELRMAVPAPALAPTGTGSS